MTLAVLACEAASAPETLAEALALRRAGTHFALSVRTRARSAFATTCESCVPRMRPGMKCG
jgi:hypothetical protein